ncbi:hypothetical protein TNIN_25791 [Trichonephila inaurata madagascariensis]|uniref:Uncharacterized protein n=1 Tax=Trichonephila inaurata madagascariensis TaxID=2747483 RepID=A0A8X6YDM8_9ARAC|nr:hypothetical protein TNIN_25791 [Trichonephila inaurata madagascariensis]
MCSWRNPVLELYPKKRSSGTERVNKPSELTSAKRCNFMRCEIDIFTELHVFVNARRGRMRDASLLDPIVDSRVSVILVRAECVKSLSSGPSPLPPDRVTDCAIIFEVLSKLDWHKISRETSPQKIVWKFIPPPASWREAGGKG